MQKLRVAGHIFDGIVNVGCGPARRDVAIVVPEDTSFEVLEELKNAKKIEQLDENAELVMETFTLTSWSRMERVASNFHNGIAVYWHVLHEDDFDNLKTQVNNLAIDNEDLLNAILELAEMIAEQNAEKAED